MNESWLSEAERGRLTSFPEYIPEVDLIAFFTLISADQQLIRKRSGASNRLGMALQLCALRYMGFIPENLNAAPASALKFLAHQLGIEEISLGAYGAREQTRTDHRQIIEKYLGYRRAGLDEWGRIERWLGLRALEHDRPSFLLQLLCEHLQTLKLVRPGWSVLERVVTSARQQAHEETWRIVEDQVKAADRDKLNGLLIVPKNERFTPLTRFRTAATAHSAQAILHTLEKISELKTLGIAHWDLSRINPNRMKMLAQKGRKATNQALGSKNRPRGGPTFQSSVRSAYLAIFAHPLEKVKVRM